MRLLLTMIVITAAFGMTACSHTQPEKTSEPESIQNRLAVSEEKLELLSRQVSKIQMTVNNHQRALQEPKTTEDTGAADAQPASPPFEATAPPSTPEPVREKAATLIAPTDSETTPLPSPRKASPKASPEVATEESPPASDPSSAVVEMTNPSYQHAMDMLKSGDYESAAHLFEDFAAAFSNDDLADNALYWAGECKYTRKDFTGAIQRFKRVVEEYPTGNKVSDALLKIGFSYISLGDMESAETYLKEVIAKYPFSSAGVKAEERLKRLQKN